MFFDIMIDTVFYVYRQRPATSAELAKARAAFMKEVHGTDANELEGMHMTDILPNAAKWQAFIMRVTE